MRRTFKHIVLILLSLLMLFPLVFVLLGSSNDSGWAFNQPFSLTFGAFFKTNISNLITQHNIFKVVFNSFISALLTAFLSSCVVFSMAYATEKYDFKGKKIIAVLMLSLIVVPEHSYLIGQLLVINKLNLYSTLAGLVIPFIVNVRIFYYIREAITFIPDHLIEAARVDGASDFKIMVKISLPLILDKLVLSFFILFIAAWNNFLIPMIITNKSELFTLPILISSLADDMRYDLGAVFMALFIAIVPILVIYSLIQKKVIHE